MGDHKLRCSEDQQQNRDRLLAELKTAARLGKRLGISAGAMHALLIERDAMGQFTDEPRRKRDPKEAARGFSVADGVHEITCGEFVASQGWPDTRPNQMRAGEILRGLGFHKVRRMESGVRRWVYFRT